MRLGVCGVLVALVASSCAQVTPAGSGFLFRLHLTKGEKLKFKAPVQINGLGSGPINVNFKLTISVIDVSKSKIATVHGVFDSADASSKGMLPTRSETIKVDSLGHVIGQANMTGFCVAFPRSPIKVGAAFTSRVPIVLASGNGKISQGDATFTFKGFSGSGKKRAARLTFIVSGGMAPSGAILVSMSDGVLLKYFTKFYLNATGGTPVQVVANFIRS